MNTLYWLVLTSLCLFAGLVSILIRWRRRWKRKAAIERELAAMERAATLRNLEERCRPPIARKQTQRSEFPRKDAKSSPPSNRRASGDT
jgi:hypothetical protein